jgi:hypothetical protein
MSVYCGECKLWRSERRLKAVVRKGMDPQYDNYSSFQDDGRVRGDKCRSIRN